MFQTSPESPGHDERGLGSRRQARMDPGSTLVLRSARAEMCHGQLRLELGRPEGQVMEIWAKGKILVEQGNIN